MGVILLVGDKNAAPHCTYIAVATHTRGPIDAVSQRQRCKVQVTQNFFDKTNNNEGLVDRKIWCPTDFNTVSNRKVK